MEKTPDIKWRYDQEMIDKCIDPRSLELRNKVEKMTKKATALARLDQAYEAAQAMNPAGAGLVVYDTIKRLRWIARNSDPALSDYQPITINQHGGPTLKYHAITLAEYDSKKDDRDRWTAGTIDRTPAGAYVAVLERHSDIDGEIDIVTALVVEPGPDEQARRDAVMEHFKWSDAAKGMAKKLGWSFVKEIE